MKAEIKEIIMKLIPLVVLLSFFASWIYIDGKYFRNKPNEEIHYINVDFVIDDIYLKKNYRGNIERTFFIKMIKDTSICGEYQSLNYKEMSDYVWNKYKIGDTLNFDFIKKSRFYQKLYD